MRIDTRLRQARQQLERRHHEQESRARAVRGARMHWHGWGEFTEDIRALEQARLWLWELWTGHAVVNTHGSLWQADHVVPVSEGGGASGLDNYRTLCLPCHKAVTKELASRLAAARRQREQEFMVMDLADLVESAINEEVERLTRWRGRPAARADVRQAAVAQLLADKFRVRRNVVDKAMARLQQLGGLGL